MNKHSILLEVLTQSKKLLIYFLLSVKKFFQKDFIISYIFFLLHNINCIDTHAFVFHSKLLCVELLNFHQEIKRN